MTAKTRRSSLSTSNNSAQSNFTSSGLTTVPTAAYRNGDFSTALCNSYTGGAAGRYGRYLYAL